MSPNLDPAFVRHYGDFEKAHQLAFTEPILSHLQVPSKHEGPMSEVFRVMIGVLKNRLWANVGSGSKGGTSERYVYGEETLPTTIPCTDPRG